MQSKFKIGSKKLHELEYDELLECVDTLWESKNKEISELEAKCKAYESLINSNFPVHSLWRYFDENAIFMLGVFLILFLCFFNT